MVGGAALWRIRKIERRFVTEPLPGAACVASAVVAEATSEVVELCDARQDHRSFLFQHRVFVGDGLSISVRELDFRSGGGGSFVW